MVSRVVFDPLSGHLALGQRGGRDDGSEAYGRLDPPLPPASVPVAGANRNVQRWK